MERMKEVRKMTHWFPLTKDAFVEPFICECSLGPHIEWRKDENGLVRHHTLGNAVLGYVKDLQELNSFKEFAFKINARIRKNYFENNLWKKGNLYRYFLRKKIKSSLEIDLPSLLEHYRLKGK